MKLKNAFSQTKASKIKPTPKGSAGYDNPRENIDPHIKTKVVDTKELNVNGIPYAAGGDVTAAANLTDNNVIIGDGGAKGISASSVTEAEVETLTDNSMADALHRHSELSASDGTPDQALTVDATGRVNISYDLIVDTNLLFVDVAPGYVGIGTATPGEMLDVVGNAEINGNIIVSGTVDGVDIAARDHSNATDHTQNTDTLTTDHGAAATDLLVNVCYGTGAAPAANTTTIGSLYVTYTA